MKVNSDVYRRIAECKNPTKSRKNVIALISLVAAVFALCVIVSGPIGSAMDRKAAGEKKQFSPAVKEIQKNLRGW